MIQKMHLEYRNDQRKPWNFDDSSVNSTLIDSTFSIIPPKRFQRSNSKNGHQSFQSPPSSLETKTTRPGSFKIPTNQYEGSSPQFKSAFPTTPTNATGESNNFSIYSPQYIKIPRSPSLHQIIEQREAKNQSSLLLEASNHYKAQSGLRNLNDWKPTDFKKLSDLQQKKTGQCGKENTLSNFNQNSNSSGSFFSKNKQPNTRVANASMTRKNSFDDPPAESLEEKIVELEKNNFKMQRQMKIILKQKEELHRQLQGYKKQKTMERQNSKHAFLFQQNAGKDKKLSKNNHNRSVGEINKNKSLKQAALTHQIEQLKEQLSRIKSENGITQFQQIIAELQEQNSQYKKTLDAVNLRCRILDQQNRSMADREKDSRKVAGQIRYLKARLEESQEQIGRLKGENKKLKASRFSNMNYFDTRGSINGNGNMPSETDSLNLSMSWMEK